MPEMVVRADADCNAMYQPRSLPTAKQEKYKTKQIFFPPHDETRSLVHSISLKAG
jgi:hypothetical protein